MLSAREAHLSLGIQGFYRGQHVFSKGFHRSCTMSGTLCQAQPKIPDSQRKADFQHKPHCSYKQLSTGSSHGEKPREIRVPKCQPRAKLWAGVSEHGSHRPAVLTLCCAVPAPGPQPKRSCHLQESRQQGEASRQCRSQSCPLGVLGPTG